MKWIVFTYNFLLLVSSVPAQPSENCLKVLENYYTSIEGTVQLNERDVYYMRYQQKTVMKEDQNNEIPWQKTEVYANKYKAVLLSDRLKVFQDTIVIITVLPDQKMIQISKSAKLESNIAKQILKQQFLKGATVEHCNVDDKKNYTIKLKVNQQLNQLYGYYSFAYIFNPQEPYFKEMTVNYTSNSAVKQISWKFDEVNPVYATNVLHKDPWSFIMADGKLKKEYMDYQVVNKLTNESTQ